MPEERSGYTRLLHESEEALYNLVRIRLKAVRAAVIIENRIKNSKYTNRYKESKKDIFGNQKEGLSDNRVKLNNFAKSEKSNCKNVIHSNSSKREPEFM